AVLERVAAPHAIVSEELHVVSVECSVLRVRRSSSYSSSSSCSSLRGPESRIRMTMKMRIHELEHSTLNTSPVRCLGGFVLSTGGASGMQRAFFVPAVVVLGMGALRGAGSLRAAADGAVIETMDTVCFQPPREKGRVNVVPGRVGNALRFAFDRDCRSTFF